jgi:hypothetical protein
MRHQHFKPGRLAQFKEEEQAGHRIGAAGHSNEDAAYVPEEAFLGRKPCNLAEREPGGWLLNGGRDAPTIRLSAGHSLQGAG